MFRARSTGGGNPSTGIFVRDMLGETSGIVRQAGRRTTVPGPNNLNTTFFEFPSFPRMSISSYHIATRGNHGPVLQYEIDDENTTKVGNTGLYFNLVAENDIETDSTSPNLQTGMAKLGSVPEYSIYEVPGLDKEYAGTVFDVFPGSPAIEDDGIIGFKGNYAKGNESQTGVFHRQLVQQVGGGDGKVFVVANSDTETFGSTSPPSIANSKMVFIGLNVEEDPKCGAIYQAEMHSSNFPELQTLVNFQTLVPGEDNQKFTRFGEGISYDGNAVSFWGGWGDEFETILLCCPATGNEDRRSFCLYNDTNTIYDPETAPEGCDSGRYQTKTVPVNQGIFVYNEVSGSVETVAKGSTKEGTDFIFWNYSGKPPGAGGSHSGDPSTARRRRLDGAADESDAAEVPRWRASATVALSSYNSVAFKKKQNDVVGIYHWEQLDGYNIDSTIVETGVKCTTFDPLAVSSVDGTPLEVESVAMERDSFRGTRLVVSIACAAEEADESDIGDDDDGDGEDVEADWGGIYMTRWCTEGSRPIGY